MKNYKDNTSGEWDFRKPTDGWHLIQFGDGIDYLKNKKGEVWEDEKTGQKALKLPALVADEKDESNGLDASIIVPVTEGGEQRMANILAACGLYKKFAERFPGDIGMFNKDVLDAIKVKLPGQTMKVRLETNKKGKQNFVEYTTADAKVENKNPAPLGSSAPPAQAGMDW